MLRGFIFIACLFSLSTLNAQVDVEIDSFDKIQVFGKLQVRLVEGDSERLIIESTSVDVNQVDYAVKEGVLKIKLLNEFPKEAKIFVTINYKTLHEIVNNGFAKVYNRGVLKSEHLYIAAKSGGQVDLDIKSDSTKFVVNKGGEVLVRGESDKVVLKTSTGGAYRARTMNVKTMECTMNGGTAEVRVYDSLEGNVFMGALLRYVRTPKKLIENTKFKGKIEPMEDIEAL